MNDVVSSDDDVKHHRSLKALEGMGVEKDTLAQYLIDTRIDDGDFVLNCLGVGKDPLDSQGERVVLIHNITEKYFFFEFPKWMTSKVHELGGEIGEMQENKHDPFNVFFVNEDAAEEGRNELLTNLSTMAIEMWEA